MPLPSNSVYGKGNGWPKIFAHLHPKLHEFEAICHELPTIPFNFFVVIADASEEILYEWRAPNIEVSGMRVDMTSVLEQADAVICYAGHSTAALCAAAGKPIILIPRDLEQMLTAIAIQYRHLGIFPNWKEKQPLRKSIEVALFSSKIRAACKDFSGRHKNKLGQSQKEYAALEILKISKSASKSQIDQLNSILS
jgi:UDP:flavonoid glycosyltransferase YjiC (YdhE family)